ncbi:WSC domain containing protein [Blumeria hordei DH14]|uniref:WSC domain containing protein n=1 Tax=Blumeria graminis f. sp. hordei (strain DH14) TaxID=546991 RepID=N1J6I6_BLUG1|nr:WSC domain containing protein [Blumeria hordei DH14]
MKSTSALTTLAIGLFTTAKVFAASASPKGCYSSSNGLTLNGSQTFNSIGACSQTCLATKSVTMAMQDSNCYCGSKLPPTNSLADDAKCAIPCPGYPSDVCKQEFPLPPIGQANQTGGGNGFYSVYLTGLSAVVENSDSSDSSSSSSSSTTSPSKSSATSSASPSIVTVGGQTVVVTANPESTSSSTPKPAEPNKAGVAVGIVFGLLGFAALAGGILVFMRNRKRRAIEEEHRQAAAVNSFIDGGKYGGPVTDTRLDPAAMATRRMSDGSIADNQDYSRRILKVTNA